MDPQSLADVATEAIEHTLRFHRGPEAKLYEDDRQVVRDTIRAKFPLRHFARDIDVAYLEIACDAAVAFAEVFNETEPASEQINMRWFYICVQSLLTIKLKPELLQDGQVDRLAFSTAQPARSPDLRPKTGLSSPADDAPTSYPRDSSGEQAVPAAVRPYRSKWEAHEMQQVVQLKQSGLTHKIIAERIGRSKSAVENKYGHIMKAEKKQVQCPHGTTSDRPPKRQHDEECAFEQTSGKRVCLEGDSA